MKKEPVSKRKFLVVSMMCLVPSLLIFIRGIIFGFGWYLPIAALIWISSIAVVSITYYFYRKKYLLKTS